MSSNNTVFACLLFAGQGLIDNKRPHDHEQVASFFKGMNLSDGGGPPTYVYRTGRVPARDVCRAGLYIRTDPNRSKPIPVGESELIPNLFLIFPLYLVPI
jgi:hypothetical protein